MDRYTSAKMSLNIMWFVVNGIISLLYFIVRPRPQFLQRHLNYTVNLGKRICDVLKNEN